MKPTKMRNRLIYRASHVVKSKQVSSHLSKELKKKFSKNSIRIVEGDSVKIVRGEFKGVDGKVSKISIQKNSLSIEGVKKEKTKGEKFDVYIHSSNVIVTGLNSDDKWRSAKLEGKKPTSKSKTTPSKETKEEKTKKLGYDEKKSSNKETELEKTQEKEDEKKETSNKQTKEEKTQEMEDEK